MIPVAELIGYIVGYSYGVGGVGFAAVAVFALLKFFRWLRGAL